MAVPLEYYLAVSGMIFVVGLLGVLIRRNALIIFISVEILMNGVNLALVAFARALDSMVGQTFVIFIVTVAAAEAAVGLALIMGLQRQRETVDVEQVDLLKE
jgi:NADH-quinone oxidoreductase subunit K